MHKKANTFLEYKDMEELRMDTLYDELKKSKLAEFSECEYERIPCDTKVSEKAKFANNHKNGMATTCKLC